jgi:hypothetical protein
MPTQSIIPGFNIYCNFCQKSYPGCNTCKNPIGDCPHSICNCEVIVEKPKPIKKYKPKEESISDFSPDLAMADD